MMWYWMKKGWAIAWEQPFAVFALFLYNLAWGVLTYKLVQSIVVPLLHRYPGKDLSHEAAQLFWVEGQFQLMKTDLLVPYVWWAGALVGLRMLLSPILNAGIYYSLSRLELNAGYRFVEGIRKLALPFLGLYAMQTILSLAPLYWLVPHILHQFGEQTSYADLGKALLPAASCFIAYVFLLQLFFLYLQVGKADGRSTLYTMLFVLRQAPMIILTALCVWAVTFIVSAAVMASAFIWAGLAALILFQAYRLLHMFLKMWAISTQYALWSEKA